MWNVDIIGGISHCKCNAIKVGEELHSCMHMHYAMQLEAVVVRVHCFLSTRECPSITAFVTPRTNINNFLQICIV